MAKAHPTVWLDRAAQIRGLGRGAVDPSLAPMLEKVAARLEEMAIVEAEERLRAKERGKRCGDKSGGGLNDSIRSRKDDDVTSRRNERRTRPGP